MYYPTPTLVLSPWLPCPLAVGFCRCPQVRDQAPSFTSVTDAVTYASAQQAVDKAESAEAQALAAAVALEATLQADAEAEAYFRANVSAVAGTEMERDRSVLRLEMVRRKQQAGEPLFTLVQVMAHGKRATMVADSALGRLSSATWARSACSSARAQRRRHLRAARRSWSP